jgi:hypothetical protein
MHIHIDASNHPLRYGLNRYAQYKSVREHIDKLEGGLEAFSRGYEKFGFNRRYDIHPFFQKISEILLNIGTF